MDTTATQLSREAAEITTGHWIFAGIFAIVFIVFLAWAYRSDSKTHKRFKIHGSTVLYFIVILLFILFILKRAFL